MSSAQLSSCGTLTAAAAADIVAGEEEEKDDPPFAAPIRWSPEFFETSRRSAYGRIPGPNTLYSRAMTTLMIECIRSRELPKTLPPRILIELKTRLLHRIEDAEGLSKQQYTMICRRMRVVPSEEVERVVFVIDIRPRCCSHLWGGGELGEVRTREDCVDLLHFYHSLFVYPEQTVPFTKMWYRPVPKMTREEWERMDKTRVILYDRRRLVHGFDAIRSFDVDDAVQFSAVQFSDSSTSSSSSDDK